MRYGNEMYYHPSLKLQETIPIMPSKKIALVTCSTREPRLNPVITSYILDVLSHLPGSEEIVILDLKDQGLPLYDEPRVPSHLPKDDPTPHYQHQHTQKWSDTVRQYDAFIFITPQYNWSIPASLKNALDYLYYEWRDKPAAMITYGGRGGGKAAGHLRQILQGLRMRPVPTAPGLIISTKTLDDYLETGQTSLEATKVWEASGVKAEISLMYLELLEELRKS